MVHQKLEYETIFLTPSLIGSLNDRVDILTNPAGSSHGVKKFKNLSNYLYSPLVVLLLVLSCTAMSCLDHNCN